MSLVGQRIGEFEILELLGAGGMGAVYKARQTSLGRFVALKTLQPGLAWDEKDIARFRQEAKAAARLNHPNLVQVYSAGETQGLHWFAMEYVEGESAMARLERKGRLAPQEAIVIVTHVATALDYGWRKAGLIHRDVKPDNIFLSQAGEVKLGDLGVAKNAEQTATQTGTGASIGTPNYMSPEQVEEKKVVDLRSDIYSLGCTLYHLLSGRPPFEAKNAAAVMLKHLGAPVPDLRSAWPECPADLATAVEKMMQKEPAARQQSYGDVNADLQIAFQELSGESVPSVVAMTRRPTKRGKGTPTGAAERTTPTALWIGGSIAICVAVWALLSFGSRKEAGDAGERAYANGAVKQSLTLPRTQAAASTPANSEWKPPVAPPPAKAAASTPVNNKLKPRPSRVSSTNTTIRFINQSGKQARLFWIDTEGRLNDYGSLKPDELREQGTYVGHVWWVEGADGIPLAIFEAGAANSDAVIPPAGKVALTAEPAPMPTEIAPNKGSLVNSLGMEFVPVPISGGPTDTASSGVKVLFAVTDTTVAQYSEFVQAKGLIWEKPSFEQAPDHPAVNVSWEDANAFCDWLTSEDRRSGKLPDGAKYRLPSDHEWSCALGIGAQEMAEAAPKDKSDKVAGFPWGAEWPPPKGAGNYPDSALKKADSRSVALKAGSRIHIIDGYDDGYAYTSPVKAFRPNAFGLYDMGGNVWQWCLEKFDPADMSAEAPRVLRGSSWRNGAELRLRSSNRFSSDPTSRKYHFGFRCVCVVGSGG